MGNGLWTVALGLLPLGEREPPRSCRVGWPHPGLSLCVRFCRSGSGEVCGAAWRSLSWALLAGHIHLTGQLPGPAFRTWVCLESQHSGNLILPKVTLPGHVWRRPPETISRSRGAGLCPTASLMWRRVHGVPQGARRVAAELPCPI